jgi:hypothetical protein
MDLANEDLVRDHIYVIWLAETGQRQGVSFRSVLNLIKHPELPLHYGPAITASLRVDVGGTSTGDACRQVGIEEWGEWKSSGARFLTALVNPPAQEIVDRGTSLL